MLATTFNEMIGFANNHKALILARATIEPLLAVIMDITLADSGVNSWALTLLNVILFIFSALVVRYTRKYHHRFLMIPGMKNITAVGPRFGK